MPRNIDLDRGVVCSRAKEGPGANIDVYMYKDEPGKYYNTFGVEVSEEMAKTAGLNVELYGKARKKREMRAAAESKIEAELEMIETSKTVKEKDGYAMVKNALGLCQIQYEGQALHTGEQAWIPQKNAEDLWKMMVEKKDPAKEAREAAPKSASAKGKAQEEAKPE